MKEVKALVSLLVIPSPIIEANDGEVIFPERMKI